MFRGVRWHHRGLAKHLGEAVGFFAVSAVEDTTAMIVHTWAFVRMYVFIPGLFCIIIWGIKLSEEELKLGM